MQNRAVGVLVIGIAALMGFITYSFNTALASIVNASCSHGPSCPMWGTINFQTNVSIGIMALVVAVGFYLIFFSREERVVTRVRTVKQQIEPAEITKGNYKKILGTLDGDEKKVLETAIESEGTAFQSDIVERTGFPKAKVSRVLDRLEGKKLIERRRRGMTNVIIVKR